MLLFELSCLVLLTLSSAQVASNVYQNRQRSNEYDYIIVGAGSAGSVLANRLSEDQDVHVLLLEAGGLPVGLSEIPALFHYVLGSDLDWKYVSEPQQNAAFGHKEQRIHIPRGKVLGGSSTLNCMIYTRGSPKDYDEWDKGGAKGWSWKDVLPYFKKSEDLREDSGVDEDYHGRGGYLTVTKTNANTPLRDAYLEGVESLGYKVLDVNGKSNFGMNDMHMTIRDGLRCSTEKAFLRPAASRENLDILLHAHVTKVLFDENKRAHSVRFEQNSVTREVKATREIILSAGVIGTPHILMLSGVGPKENLQELKIPGVSDLPVGQNLHDHVCSYGQVYSFNSSVSILPSELVTPENIGLLQTGQGPLTVPAGLTVSGYINTKYQEESENWPDMQLCLSASPYLPPFSDDIKELKKQYEGKHMTNTVVSLSRPKSTGVVKLRSTDPYVHPSVDFRYYTDPEDLHRVVDGMKIAHGIMKTPALQKYGASLIPLPGCKKFELASEEYFTCVAQTYTLTVYQHSGTCKMGDPNDPTTVVDPQLRVKGVKGLRVVDASVMPMVTSGTTNPPVIMIGEKAADMIKEARNQ